MYVVLSRIGIASLAIIDVSKGEINAVEIGGHKFSRIWDFSVGDGSLMVLGSSAFVDDPYSNLRYFELDLNSGGVLQYYVPANKEEAIESAKILNGGDKIGLINSSPGERKPRVCEKRSGENSFFLIYTDETSEIEDVVLFSACGMVGRVSMVVSNHVRSYPFLTVGQVKYDLYQKIGNQIYFKNLFVLEEGENAKIGVEFNEIIDYTTRRGIAVHNVEDSLCSRVNEKTGQLL